MFDLDLAIEQWKDTIGSLESIRTDDVLELESHLRSLVSELCQSGLAENEAFLVATHRLGKPVELNSEYAKVHGVTVWQKRVMWMLCGYVAYSIGSAWINAIATFASTGVAMGEMGATAAGATNVFVFAVGWAAFLVFAYLQSKKSVAGPDRISWNGALLAGFALFLGMVLEQAGLLLRNTTVEIAEIGETFIWQVYGGLVVHTCVFVAIAVLMRTLSEPKPTSAVETTS